MMRARLDGRQRSKRTVIRKLARDLKLPDYFGDNLDGLFDLLTTEVEGPVHVTWRSTPASRNMMGRDFQRIADTLEDAAKERPDLTVDIK